MNRTLIPLLLGIFLILTPIAGVSAASSSEPPLTLYSGRSETLVDPLVRSFEEQTGISVQVRYGGTSELAVLLIEEGNRTPADLFWAQDAGGLGAVSREGLLAELPEDLFSQLPEVYRNESRRWISTSGRARLYAFSPERTVPEELPESVFDLTDPRYSGRVGWAPTNGSFQAFVTGMRAVHGDEVTETWLRDMRANDVQAYRNNTALVEAIAAGEIDFSLVNNYYLQRFTSEDPDFPVDQQFFAPGDIGNMVNTAGAGIPAAGSRQEEALQFIEFLLGTSAQQFIHESLNEFPVIPLKGAESLEELTASAPPINLDALDDLAGSLGLLRNAGVL